MTARWEAGARAAGVEEFNRRWESCGDRSTLVVLGSGFDPRTAVAYENLARAAPRAPDVLMMSLQTLDTDPATADRSRDNQSRIEHAAANAGANVVESTQPTEGSQSTGMVIAREFFTKRPVDSYEQVVIDVSALPRSVFFPARARDA